MVRFTKELSSLLKYFKVITPNQKCGLQFFGFDYAGIS